jgi:nicotinate-nucleotide adenylyltransferase
MASLGILGGTFNPPHRAHLACARRALEVLGLDRVELMPVRLAPHKAPGEDPGAEHRLAMCRLSVRDCEGVVVSRLELDREGPSYTVDTLRALHAAEPEDQLTFIVGGDMARSLPTWREPETIIELATLAVVERGPADREAIIAALHDLPGSERTRFLDMPPMDVSSSLVRERAAAGEPIDGLVPPAVGAYIAEHGLYVGVPA